LRLALACNFFGWNAPLYGQGELLPETYRRSLMHIWGPASSPRHGPHQAGRNILAADPETSAAWAWPSPRRWRTRLPTATPTMPGQRPQHVMLHQTIVGLETKKQLALAGESRTCSSAASAAAAFCGVLLPVRAGQAQGRRYPLRGGGAHRLPHPDQGTYTYDFGDTAGLTP